MFMGEAGLEFFFLVLCVWFWCQGCKSFTSWVWSVPSFYSLQYIMEGQDDLFLRNPIKLIFKISEPTAGFLWVDFKFGFFFFLLVLFGFLFSSWFCIVKLYIFFSGRVSTLCVIFKFIGMKFFMELSLEITHPFRICSLCLCDSTYCSCLLLKNLISVFDFYLFY